MRGTGWRGRTAVRVGFGVRVVRNECTPYRLLGQSTIASVVASNAEEEFRVFRLLDPEMGFTSSVIRDPNRFVGRSNLIGSAMRAVNASSGLIAVFGKRGVGKSSLMRQIQLMANGDYEIVTRAGLHHLIPEKPRTYYTVYYTCDSEISNSEDLLLRLCTDTDPEDGLLRLVPDKGKELIEFSRSISAETSTDLKLAKWGIKGGNAEKYAANLRADTFQTFRNFCSAIVESNNKIWRKRAGVLIFIDEFDVVKDKSGFGSLLKSLSSEKLKFAISGISDDLNDLIEDHQSVERLIEQGSAHVKPMTFEETKSIFETATFLFDNIVRFDENVVKNIFEISLGYPYFAQLIGKSCIEMANEAGTNEIDDHIFRRVLKKIRQGEAFPSLERKYQRAIGDSDGRALLLTLLAEEKISIDEIDGGVSLKSIRATAQELEIEFVDQLVPRLIDKKYGPALVRKADQRGAYEFLDPVFRAYVRLRR